MSATNSFYLIGRVEIMKYLNSKKPLTIIKVREFGNDRFEPCEVKASEYTKGGSEVKEGDNVVVEGYVSNFKNERGYANISLNASAITIINACMASRVSEPKTEPVSPDIIDDDLPF